jgi:hypothetical protein
VKLFCDKSLRSQTTGTQYVYSSIIRRPFHVKRRGSVL